MKRYLIGLILVAALLLSGCTQQDPGYGVLIGVDSGVSIEIAGSSNKVFTQGSDNEMVTQDTEHWEIHQGNSYVATNVTDLSNGQVLDFLMQTDNVEVNIRWALEHEAEVELAVYEAPTVSATGTAIMVSNRNRQSTNIASSTAYVAPTITDAGTLLKIYHAGSAGRIGGGTESENEWLLAKNTYYLFRITNATATNNQITLALNWYEES